jgi:hypothetical protein
MPSGTMPATLLPVGSLEALHGLPMGVSPTPAGFCRGFSINHIIT